MEIAGGVCTKMCEDFQLEEIRNFFEFLKNLMAENGGKWQKMAENGGGEDGFAPDPDRSVLPCFV